MNPITAQGFERIQKELRHLITVDRPAIIEEIVRARKYGDLSENAEYHAAREKQRFIEYRIQQLEKSLSQSQVIDISSLQGPRIVFGATVTIFDEEKQELNTYQIVGIDEADLKYKRLSIASALARELVGKEEGDVVEMVTGSGEKTYTIKKVEYISYTDPIEDKNLFL
jgi:transcription elongation factor GreA